MANFFALVLIGGLVGLVIITTQPELRARVAAAALPLGGLVAAGATAGSLYFSEIADLPPCKLCWFQRIAMYPLAILLPLAHLRRDAIMQFYAAVLASVGLVISLYHIQLQLFPDQSSFCDVMSPCTNSPVKAFDVFTIPHMAAASFVLIIGVSVLALRQPPEEAS